MAAADPTYGLRYLADEWMKITDIECAVLLAPNCNVEACDSAQDTIVVEVRTDEG